MKKPFEYKKLLENIIHANSIVRRVKSLLISEAHIMQLDNLATVEKIDKNIVLNYLSYATSIINKAADIKINIVKIKEDLKSTNRLISPKKYEPTEEDLKNKGTQQTQNFRDFIFRIVTMQTKT